MLVLLADLGRIGAVFGFLYTFPYGDKIGHFILMGILAFLVSLGFPLTRVRILALHPLKGSLIVAGLVTLEEISQLLFPNRSADLVDLAASLSGIFLFGELGSFIRKRSHNG